MKIELYSPGIKRKEMDAVLTVMVDEKIGPGEQAERFMLLAKERLNFDYALSLRSPAIALYIALKALSLPPQSKVAVPAFCPKYYMNVLQALGFSPLFCDSSPASPCVSEQTILRAMENLEEKSLVKAVIITGSLGFLPDMKPIVELGLPVIEDVSCAFGSKFAEKLAGTYGVFTILGLEERDALTAAGGALLFSMEKRHSAVLRNFSDLPPECRLVDMNAAMASVQIKESVKNFEKRAEIAAVYTQAALKTRHKMFVIPDGFTYNNYAFPLVLESGLKDVCAYAKRKEIEIETAFAPPPQEAPEGSLPQSSSLSMRAILLPMHPRLSAAAVERVSKFIQTLP
ncbi:MAG: DegT/DnrJ/EryC1/StrS family aminotransferase [Spirochaetaceae bacterium]|jgi:dTDP-4-amino-4,6-dideoxygalactose transaminase|nr:DegT/DnrJ/EryC1/StrS family aminotransferase [Spirochaetaceae bacterium]